MAKTQSTKMETLLKQMDLRKFSSYQKFIRALLIEALANTDFTYDELNYKLFALKREIYNQLNKETTAFYKFLWTSPLGIEHAWAKKTDIIGLLSSWA